MKILFAASECVPFAKVGGLADVVGSLSKELAKAGDDVRVILPLYRDVAERYRTEMTHKLYFYVNLGWRRQYCGIEEMRHGDVTVYFIDNEYYFDRAAVYGNGGFGGDEGERYAFFCRAVLEALPLIDFQPDILHCHDWQTGMIPALLREQYGENAFYRDMRCVFTIHNMQHQGVFGIDYVEELLGFGMDKYVGDRLEFYGCASFMKAGIVYSDMITTVSETYAQEIQTNFYGERLDGLLSARSGHLVGVLNGIDDEDYDPKTDPAIYQTYSQSTWRDRKGYNKACLQSDLGLDPNPDAPLIGMVTRLYSQKGIDLVERVFDEIMGLGAEFVVLGKGDERYGNFFSWAAWRYGGRSAARIEMNETLARRIYAGCDMLLVPSQFEPCGLTQFYAMRYGTVPITRETGGLRDTVLSYNEISGEGNGFTFFNYNAHDMLAVIRRAVSYYCNEPEVWDALVRRGMAGDYSWQKSAEAYQAIYARALKERTEEIAAAKAMAAAEAEETPVGEAAPAEDISGDVSV